MDRSNHMDNTASIEISAIYHVNPLWKRLLLFQSWNQLFMYSTVVVGILILAVVFIYHLTKDLRAVYVSSVCGLAGSLAFINLLQRSSFSIRGAYLSDAINLLDARLSKLRFVLESHTSNGVRIYKSLASKQWIDFKENEITLSENNGSIEISGPYLFVKQLRKTALTLVPLE